MAQVWCIEHNGNQQKCLQGRVKHKTAKSLNAWCIFKSSRLPWVVWMKLESPGKSYSLNYIRFSQIWSKSRVKCPSPPLRTSIWSINLKSKQVPGIQWVCTDLSVYCVFHSWYSFFRWLQISDIHKWTRSVGHPLVVLTVYLALLFFSYILILLRNNSNYPC